MCIVVHHGGKWVHKPELAYEGGEVKIINDLPPDLDVNYLRSLINSLGYKNVIKLHYCDPFKELKLGVRFLDYESTTFGMFLSLLEKCRMIDLFTKHEDLPTEVINVDESDKHNSELICDLEWEEGQNRHFKREHHCSSFPYIIEIINL